MTETTLSAAQKMTIDIAIEALEFLISVSEATETEIISLTRAELERFVRQENKIPPSKILT